MLLTLGIFFSCSEEKIAERFYPRNDHQAYWHSLKQANLLNTALGKDWMEVAKKPFEKRINIQLPYQEAFAISPLKPDAHGYEFNVERGQKVLVNIKHISQDSTSLFVDLFRIENDSLQDFLQVASADSSLQLGFEPRKTATYLLRLQPELLRGGDFTITIESVPTLTFPVAGKDKKAIQSFFGDPRDGGRRDHHGVDIFAKRHTAIIAPTKGRIGFVGTRKLGGRVVWLYDSKRGQNLYFAHLETQLVERHQMVKPGDTIGTVGNSGNARFTPPHLHFGIYKNGPVNPYAFIAEGPERLKKLITDTSFLHKQIVLTRSLIRREQMHPLAPTVDTLAAGSAISIAGISEKYVRVITESGTFGFIDQKAITSF